MTRRWQPVFDVRINRERLNVERLMMASREGDVSKVEWCLRHGVPANADDSKALRIAKENGHTNVVALLVANGACMENEGDL